MIVVQYCTVDSQGFYWMCSTFLDMGTSCMIVVQYCTIDSQGFYWMCSTFLDMGTSCMIVVQYCTVNSQGFYWMCSTSLDVGVNILLMRYHQMLSVLCSHRCLFSYLRSLLCVQSKKPQLHQTEHPIIVLYHPGLL